MNHLNLEQGIGLKEMMNHEKHIAKKDNQIKFKTSMIMSNLCDYSDAYILVSGTTTIIGAGYNDAAKGADEINKGVIFKNCAPFTDCISNINNTKMDNAEDIDVVMPMYNLIEYSNIIQNHQEVYGNIIEMSYMII